MIRYIERGLTRLVHPSDDDIRAMCAASQHYINLLKTNLAGIDSNVFNCLTSHFYVYDATSTPISERPILKTYVLETPHLAILLTRRLVELNNKSIFDFLKQEIEAEIPLAPANQQNSDIFLKERTRIVERLIVAFASALLKNPLLVAWLPGYTKQLLSLFGSFVPWNQVLDFTQHELLERSTAFSEALCLIDSFAQEAKFSIEFSMHLLQQDVLQWTGVENGSILWNREKISDLFEEYYTLFCQALRFFPRAYENPSQKTAVLELCSALLSIKNLANLSLSGKQNCRHVLNAIMYAVQKLLEIPKCRLSVELACSIVRKKIEGENFQDITKWYKLPTMLQDLDAYIRWSRGIFEALSLDGNHWNDVLAKLNKQTDLADLLYKIASWSELDIYTRPICVQTLQGAIKLHLLTKGALSIDAALSIAANVVELYDSYYNDTQHSQGAFKSIMKIALLASSQAAPSSGFNAWVDALVPILNNHREILPLISNGKALIKCLHKMTCHFPLFLNVKLEGTNRLIGRILDERQSVKQPFEAESTTRRLNNILLCLRKHQPDTAGPDWFDKRLMLLARMDLHNRSERFLFVWCDYLFSTLAAHPEVCASLGNSQLDEAVAHSSIQILKKLRSGPITARKAFSYVLKASKQYHQAGTIPLYLAIKLHTSVLCKYSRSFLKSSHKNFESAWNKKLASLFQTLAACFKKNSLHAKTLLDLPEQAFDNVTEILIRLTLLSKKSDSFNDPIKQERSVAKIFMMIAIITTIDKDSLLDFTNWLVSNTTHTDGLTPMPKKADPSSNSLASPYTLTEYLSTKAICEWLNRKAIEISPNFDFTNVLEPTYQAIRLIYYLLIADSRNSILGPSDHEKSAPYCFSLIIYLLDIFTKKDLPDTLLQAELSRLVIDWYSVAFHFSRQRISRSKPGAFQLSARHLPLRALLVLNGWKRAYSNTPLVLTNGSTDLPVLSCGRPKDRDYEDRFFTYGTDISKTC